MDKDFDNWNRLKKDIQNKEQQLFFKEGEIWWVNLGLNIGFETDGKGIYYERPVVIIKKYNQYSFLAIPLTRAKKTSLYRVSIGNITGQESFVNVSQLRNIDSKRLINKIGYIQQEQFIILKQKTSHINFG